MNSESNRKLGPIRTPAVNLQHLRYALTAADYGSFRRAAEVLLLRQSTLSRCISQLEHSLGMTVFERSSGGVRATTAGRHFLRTARSIVEQMDSLLKSARHAGRGEAGRLSVGLYTSISAGNLRATLVDYKNRFSQIDVCLKEGSRVRLITALRNGALDNRNRHERAAIARKSSHAALERAHFVSIVTALSTWLSDSL